MRVNGRITVIKTETKTSLGGTANFYFPAKRVFELQDKSEYETISGQRIDKGLYQFLVQSKDGSRSVEIRAEEDDGYIGLPKFGDDDLVRVLPDCPGHYRITCVKRERPLIIGIGTIEDLTGSREFFTTEHMYKMESEGSLFYIQLADGINAVTVNAQKFPNVTYYLSAATPKFEQILNEFDEC